MCGQEFRNIWWLELLKRTGPASQEKLLWINSVYRSAAKLMEVKLAMSCVISALFCCTCILTTLFCCDPEACAVGGFQGQYLSGNDRRTFWHVLQLLQGWLVWHGLTISSSDCWQNRSRNQYYSTRQVFLQGENTQIKFRWTQTVSQPRLRKQWSILTSFACECLQILFHTRSCLQFISHFDAVCWCLKHVESPKSCDLRHAVQRGCDPKRLKWFHNFFSCIQISCTVWLRSGWTAEAQPAQSGLSKSPGLE